MRQIENPQLISLGDEGSASGGFAAQLGLAAGFVRRRYRIILTGLILSLPIGLAIQLFAPRTYTASAVMMIETQKGVLSDINGNSAWRDAGWVDSQIGILRSANVAAYVVKQLRLAEDNKFLQNGADPVNKLLRRFGFGEPDPATDTERAVAATGIVMRDLSVSRINQSYTIRIDFRGADVEQAQKIANSIVDGYIFDQLNAKYQSNRRAGDWLQERLQALREQTAAAERAVLEFKAKNNLVSSGGTLINDKQLGEMSGRLATARSHAMDLKTRLDRIDAVRQSYQDDRTGARADESISEELNSSIIGRLRNQYLDLVNREADWSVRYGKNHVAVVNLRNQIRDIRRSIREELGRIEESIKSEYQIAQQQQDESEKALVGLVSQSTETNQAQIALYSLQAAAQSYRKIYDNFLARHTETVQQQSLPITDARLVSNATISKTNPQMSLVWMLTVLGGVMFGAGAGLLREMMDRGLRTRDQVRAVLGADCLALMPVLPKQGFRLFRGEARVGSRRNSAQPSLAGPVRDQKKSRTIRPNSGVWQSIVDAPASAHAEAIRSIKLGLDLKTETSGPQVIGITSALPGEGKSTVAAAMAASIAQNGGHVLLIDGDLRNPTLSRALASDASVGLLEVIESKVALGDALWQDARTNMDFLPAVINPLMPPRIDLFSSNGLASLIKTLQIQYDYIIVDLAPLVAGIDVRATLRHIGSYVLVVEWGCTKVDQLQYALRHSPGIQENIAGVVLNKVDMAAMSLYDSYGAHYYYGRPRQLN